MEEIPSGVTTWNLKNGTTLSGVEAGQGDLVLLLHGFPAYHKTWKAYLEPLSRTHRVVAPDLRGYFHSSKPASVPAYRSEQVVEDIVELVRLLGHDSASLVGHDWGGALSWAAASWYPEVVDRVAVFNCPHPQAMSYHLRKNVRQMLSSWYIFLFQLPSVPEFLISRNSRKFIRLAFAARRGTFSEEDLEEYRQALLLPGALRASINYYRAAAREALKGGRDFPLIGCPSLLIWGERDVALRRELSLGMERYFQGRFERIAFPKVGHWSVNELGQEGVSLIQDFLRSGE